MIAFAAGFNAIGADGRRARARRMAGSSCRPLALHRLRGLLRYRQASPCRSRWCSRTLRISTPRKNVKPENGQPRPECASCGYGRDGRVPVWPPADTPSRRSVPVPLALTNVIVGYATSVLVESVRPFWASCNVQHKGIGSRCGDLAATGRVSEGGRLRAAPRLVSGVRASLAPAATHGRMIGS